MAWIGRACKAEEDRPTTEEDDWASIGSGRFQSHHTKLGANLSPHGVYLEWEKCQLRNAVSSELLQEGLWLLH
jgi:hypothetical protein